MSDLIDGLTGRSLLGEGSDVAKAFSMQHPLHGFIGRVWDKLDKNDPEWVERWAMEHPAQFLKIALSLVPAVQPMQGVQGEVVLKVHHTLGQTELDEAVLVDD